MKSSMRSRLEQLSHRLVEIDALLAEPATAAEMDRFRKLSRERTELQPVVAAFAAFTHCEQDLAPKHFRAIQNLKLWQRKR